MGLLDRIKNAWNAFIGEEKDPYRYFRDLGYSHTYNPGRKPLTRGNERSLITAIYNRMALDVSDVKIEHVMLDKNDRYLKPIKDSLSSCLTLEANIDQNARDFLQDIVMSMFDEGVVAVVPIDTDRDPETGSYDIYTLRTGKILQWYPKKIQVEVYNDRKGIRECILVSKQNAAIIQNPLYAIMNEKNSTLQRLIRKLNLLDVIDEQSGSGRLDLIIQLPYIVKTEARKRQAEQRRVDIESQLSRSKYGIAYTDGTEKITQLNRSVENNLLKQIEYLTSMLYSQLGITTSVMDGTADEKTMLNYINRTIKPIIASISLEMTRKFLTQTARTQGHIITYFNEPFKLVPVSQLADIADKFTRNEIMSSNEMRQVIGMKPVNDPKADELSNKNLNPGENQTFANTTETVPDSQNIAVEGENQNG